MAARKVRPKNVLADKLANVSLARNGLTIEVPGVPAMHAAQVAGALLDAVRQMVKVGYEELVPDAGSVHAGPLGEYTEDDHAEQSKHKVGFR